MRAVTRILCCAGIVAGASLVSSPSPLAAQSTVQKVETGVSKAAKTTKHNVVKAGKTIKHRTKHARHRTVAATSNLIHGHRILCGDGTWASRDNPSCSGHAGVASRQPGDKDKSP